MGNQVHDCQSILYLNIIDLNMGLFSLISYLNIHTNKQNETKQNCATGKTALLMAI